MPPTSEAARQHCLRAYFQVQTWIGNDSLNPVDWGWKLHNNVLVPHRTEKAIAHDKLLNLISCGCKKGCKQTCTCRKMGMACTDMCAKCSEFGCTNSVLLEEDTTGHSGNLENHGNESNEEVTAPGEEIDFISDPISDFSVCEVIKK